MPSFVSFNPKPAFARPAGDDERYLMSRFAHHASKCRSCAHPLVLVAQGRSLCERGTRHALNLRPYIRNRGGKPYSQVDHERGQSIQIEVPPDCEVIRELMLAFERGMVIQPPKPSRTVVVHNPNEVTRQPQPPERRRTISTEVVGITESGRMYRGSLYHDDMLDHISYNRRWSAYRR